MKTLDEAMQILVRTEGMSDAEALARIEDVQSQNQAILEEVCQNEHACGLADHMGAALYRELNAIAIIPMTEGKRSEVLSECVRKFLLTAFGNGVMIGIHMERHEDKIS